jgi:hypothetical protein
MTIDEAKLKATIPEPFKIYLTGSITDNPNAEADFSNAEKRLYLLTRPELIFNPYKEIALAYKKYNLKDADLWLSAIQSCLIVLTKIKFTHYYQVTENASPGVQLEKIVFNKLNIKELKI